MIHLYVPGHIGEQVLYARKHSYNKTLRRSGTTKNHAEHRRQSGDILALKPPLVLEMGKTKGGFKS